MLLVAAGCTASGVDVEPPADVLFYPTGAAVSPDDAVLFVTNGNSELRYNGGTISVFDLALVDQAVAAWTGADHTIPSGCNRDPDFSETLVCDEAPFMIANAAVRIGNFATQIAMQDRGQGRARLIVPTRGDPSVEWIDWDGAKLSCAAGDFSMCDDAHRLTYVHGDANVGLLPTEPFDAWADSAGQYAIVTHLAADAVTLIDSPNDGDATIADVGTGFFMPDPLTGSIGTSGVGGLGDIAYVGSPFEDRVQTFAVGRPGDAPPYLIPEAYFFLDGVGANAGNSSNNRALVASHDGSRLYELNRTPPSVMTLENMVPTAGVDVCREAEHMATIQTADGERLFVTCFQDGQLDIIDPRGASMLVDSIPVGRGPYAAAAAASRGKVYVTNFLEDTIAVVDVASGSPTMNRVVMKIGQPKPPEAEPM